MDAITQDPYRYVLSDDAPLLKNLSALWTIDPNLAAAIEQLHPRNSYPVQGSKSGPPTVSVPTADGRMVLLHSRHEPVEEAKKLADALKFAGSVAFYIFGFGLGYHIEQLFEKSSDEAIFCIFEPDLLLLRTAFEHRDLSRLIESRRLMFFTKPDKADLLLRLTPHSALISVGAARIEHAASMQVAGEFHRQMQTWLDEFSSFSRTSLNTVVLNSRRTAENISCNLGWYVATPGLSRLAERYRQKPAVIVSAGPSLRKNKHLLKGLEDRAVIIAVQTTLQPLLGMGIEPHFVTSLDYHEICTRFFEKLPPRLNAELVAEPKANSAILNMYPGPISLLGNQFAESLLREMNIGKPQLTGGATVAHLAFYLAEHLGCDPIIFVGQDLGFSDGLFYSPGTSYEDVWRPELGRFCTVEMKQWEQIVRERFILRKIPDQQGRPMYTEERMFTYLQQFERDFLRCKSRVIDATEGGAAKRGTTVMPLAEAIEKFCTQPLGAMARDYPRVQWERLDECVESLGRRLDEARRIEQISAETLPKLQEIRDHIDDQHRVNRAIGQIDLLRVRMNELGATYDLVTELTQPTQLDRFTADRKISAEKVEGLEKQRRQVARDIENVRGVMQAAGDFQRLIAQVRDQLRSESAAQARGVAA
ncbi:MAG TPA: 6-hydroxymethylpterin diphosphokinase MptE-like protein [Tepidisphaeraceae bacterium]|jgi:hypothetical protein|nr:6-hydroxymethylpterin diphosphokinase MptE-like protein [Tepidisphaeraceae bacterium]